MLAPNNWFTHYCECCHEETLMNFINTRPEPIFCPHCGTAVEDADHLEELDFNL